MNINLYLQKEGPQGLSVNWKGHYDEATTYQVNDAVYYNSSSYICTAVTTGHLPTDTNYWGLMSSGMGDFSGPSSSVKNNFVSFDTEDGKLGKDSGYNGNSFEPKNANIQTHISSISNPHSVTKSQVGLGNVQNVDQTNPANITQSSSYRFVTDTEKSTWNAKQDAIGYTPENVANKTSTFQATPDNTKYPTEKLVKDSLDLKEDEANKKTTITSSDTDYPTCKAVETALAGKQPTGSYEVTSNKKTTLTDSDTDYPTTKAVNTGLSGKENTIGYTTENVANKSTSIPNDGTSDTKYPSAKAVKDYTDGLVAGLLDYRGGYNASGNTYPTTGGSGTAGAVMKGDMWVISVAGTLGGEAIQVGDSIIANVDTPAQTSSNWNHLNGNVSYVPEDVANKVTSLSSGSTDTQYPSAKLTYDQLALKENLTNRRASFQVTPDDTHYITEKLAYDQLLLKEDKTNKVTSISGSSTDVQYPTAKLLFDQLALKLNVSAKALFSDINTGTDDTKYVTPLAIKNSFIGQNPTLYTSSIASKGGVYNGNISIYPSLQTPTTVSGRYPDGTAGGSTTDTIYGWYTYFEYGATLLLSNGFGTLSTSATPPSSNHSIRAMYNANNLALSKNAIPISNKIYRISVDLETIGITSTNSRGARFYGLLYSSTYGANTSVSTSYVNGTTNKTTYTIVVDNSAGTYAFLNPAIEIRGEEGTVKFSNFKLQEVSSLIPTNTIPETLLGTFQAQNSTAIDQSLDPTGAYANTYALTNAINEGATHRQTFTPTKTKGYSISIWPIAKGSGDWTVVVHDASNKLISSRTIANASIVEGAMNDFVFPSLFIAGQPYHFHVYSSVADGTLKANTSDDLETGSFIQYYSKLSEGFTVVSNGIRTNLMASSKDGLLGGSVLNLDSGKWRYKATANSITDITSAVYQSSVGGWTAIGSNFNVINGFEISPNGLSLGLRSNTGATERYITWKVNTILPIKHLKFRWGNYYTGDVLQVSSNNIDWTPLTVKNSSGAYTTHQPETDLLNGETSFYVRIYKDTTDTYLWTNIFEIEADIDTSSIPLPTIYPLAVNQFTTPPIKLATAPTRAYFRLNKYVNENNVMMPAIEFTDASANPLGYSCVAQDNSQETNPCCKLLDSSSGYTGSGGTGTVEGNGMILNDGEYMTITGSATDIKIDYQLGTGTTAISAITKNIAYLSSNSAIADATLDASLQFNALLGVRQQGLVSKVGDLENDIADIKYELEKLNGLPYIRTLIVNTATTLNETHQTVLVTGATTITLPSAIGLSGRTYNIIRTGTDNVTISPVLSQTISGDASLVLTTQWDSVVIISDGANWIRCS